MFAASPDRAMPLGSSPTRHGGYRREQHAADDTGTTDCGTACRALVKTKPYLVGGPMTKRRITETQLYAKVRAATTVRITLDGDYGLETRTADVSLAASASERAWRGRRKTLTITSAQTVQAQIGDARRLDSGVELDALMLRHRQEQCGEHRVPFRDALRTVSIWLEEELDRSFAGLQAWSRVEHHDDGTHSTVTGHDRHDAHRHHFGAHEHERTNESQ